MADFRPGTICTHATPIPEGHEILQRLLTNDCRMLAPILKLIATVLLFRSYARLKIFFWKMREVVPFLRSYHICFAMFQVHSEWDGTQVSACMCVASFPGSRVGEEERQQPGAHCLYMRQVPLVTCILSCYTKIWKQSQEHVCNVNYNKLAFVYKIFRHR